MPLICYKEQRFNSKSMKLIDKVNEIIAEYEGMRIELTLRQVYYQLVARDIVKNNLRSYKNVGQLINNARLAGHIDWYHITDMTRELRGLNHWDDPGDIISNCVHTFHLDKWEGQKYRVEVWVEKDALRSIVSNACVPLDVDFFSCRGYTSQSEMWAAAQRLIGHESDDKKTIVLHIGDHDPSGIDMTRDIEDRLRLFGSSVEVKRLALNMDQVRKYQPPPNPAKTTDSRFAKYIAKHGSNSWELDALNPEVLIEIIQKNIRKYLDKKKFNAQVAREENGKDDIRIVASQFEECVDLLKRRESGEEE